jgi:N4-(beta-N-acetylglucosaminyl)-L-asparaginase
MSMLTRRELLAGGAAAAVCGKVLGREQSGFRAPGHPIAVASLNGLRSVARAVELMREGYDPADAVVQGVRIVEDDPDDDSVGLGGLPNADGVVELDASVMHGPTHKSGAVASLRNIRNPAMVALLVLRRTDHCLLVGEGALRFAKSHGFREEDLLTERSRREWMKWRENMSRDDDWLNDDERDAPVGRTWDRLPWEDERAVGEGRDRRGSEGPGVEGGDTRRTAGRSYIMEVTGTIHCSGMTGAGDIASCTTTSGLNWKIPGRVGDSPIIGAGNYCDNEIGAAGSTGRGEANIVTLAAARIVDWMGAGKTPEEACLAMCRYVVDHMKEKRLWRTQGDRRVPVFDLKFYALRKDGLVGGASLWSGGKMAVCDAQGARAVEVPFLYER